MVNVEAVTGYAGADAAEVASSYSGLDSRRLPRWRAWKVEAALATADAAAAAAATGAVLWAFSDALDLAEGEPATLAAASSLLGVCLHRLLGLYDTWRCSPFLVFRQRVLAALITAGCIAIPAASHQGLIAAFATWAACVLASVSAGTFASVVARSSLMRAQLWCEPVVLVGEPDATQAFATALGANPHCGYRAAERVVAPAAVIDGSLGEGGASAATGSGAAGAQCAILLSRGDTREDQRITAMLRYPTVIILRDVGALQTLGVEARAIGEAAGLSIHRSLLVPHNLRLKRLFDLAIAVPALLAALPVIAFSALAVWLIDRGDPFYSQLREGQHGHMIRVWKLRTMFRDADHRLAEHLATNPEARAEWQRRFKLSADPRILPVIGNFLRRSSFDELPQLWNVVRGDMSLVGPRPFPAYHLDTFTRSFRHLRSSVVPGLTGLWQVQERSLGDTTVQERCDTFYIRNWSIWLDLYIILQTVPAVLSGRGAR